MFYLSRDNGGSLLMIFKLTLYTRNQVFFNRVVQYLKSTLYVSKGESKSVSIIISILRQKKLCLRENLYH